MYSPLVLVLLSVLGLWTTLPVVAGDCWDDRHNNKESYDNCDSCYQTFANALINIGDNKYQLSKAFFPIDRVPPVEVEVTYTRNNTEMMADKNDSMVWYWLMGGFYLFQPLELFVYRSLFFSPPTWRKDSLTLVLPDQCFSNESYFFEYATQRLKGYAQSQSSTPAIDNTYMGKAVAGNTVKITSENFYASISPHIVEAFFIIPFLIVMTVITVFIAVYVINAIAMGSVPFEEEMNVIKKNENLKANIIAGLLVCIIMTLYTAGVDIASLAKEKEPDLPSYYHKSSIFSINVVFLIIYILYFISGGIALSAYAALYKKYFIDNYHNCLVALCIVCIINIMIFCIVIFIILFLCYKSKPENMKKSFKMDIFLILSVLCFVKSALLSFSLHFPHILMAWITDPFYASRIGLFYGIIIFCYFTTFHYAYAAIFSAQSTHGCSKFCMTCMGFMVFPVSITGLIATVSIFVASIPVNNSIESSTDGISSIYNGVIILIGGLVAYRVGGHYFEQSFSWKDALKKALKNTPNQNKIDWKNMNAEERLEFIMKKIVGHVQQMKLPQENYSSSTDH